MLKKNNIRARIIMLICVIALLFSLPASAVNYDTLQAITTETERNALVETISTFFNEVYGLDGNCDLNDMFVDEGNPIIEHYNEKSKLFLGIPKVYDNPYVNVAVEAVIVSIEKVENGFYEIDVNAEIEDAYLDEPTDIGYSRIPYTFTVAGDSRDYKIISVSSNDTLDSILKNRSAAEQLNVLRNSLLCRTIDPSMDAIEAMYMREEASVALRSTSISYNRDAAVSYAHQYALSNNPAFPSYTSNCQNFASQCVWAGYGGQTVPTSTDNVTAPMVHNENDDTMSWYHCDGDYEASVPWRRCSPFMNYVGSNISNREGPVGWVYSGTDTCLKYAQPGDLIYVYDPDYIDSIEEDLADHVYIVVSTSNAYGSNNINTIRVAAHTNPHDNYPLSSTGYETSDFALLRMGTWHGN